ncbi:ribokinase [Paraburkholderia azotifigens]|uniref:Ribokinase n=1 Tax=Paraburkholderia azotifigens TaxID=2057004 RepID=A0A5C6V355_9BURK|nr:ribokinase [Paraburkholderia azotifigens]TXC79822.1 ribokinase [Paraburkholderia azotifigens]
MSSSAVAPLIVVVGSANMDLVVHASRLPLRGETLLGERFETVNGGKGANQAVAAARVGGTVAMVGCVGGDAFGASLRDALHRERIDGAHVHTIASQPSGIASITVGRDGANSIVVAPGANACVSTAHVDAAADLIARADMLIGQLEVPLATIAHAINIAARNGTPVLLNPAPAQPLPDTLYRQIDYLLVNETEAALLTGLHVSGVPCARFAADALLGKGVRNVIVTLGAQGAIWAGAQGSGYMAAPVVRVVDTTAAGDTFAGGFAVVRASGASMQQSIAFAQRAAAASVTRAGAQPSIPFLAELEEDSISEV